ncbi:oxygen-dependent tRNA uridine(34) hydroxylase TrhO [Pantoea sp. SoEX]|uniref:oxygen-dependent tRNA uridine(34) hydroxylase TrhO n=1 Tax=Pantoea sp. SoEX TaxID=2576763 RepID=UPI00135966DE|nr:rhodanese-related sulfurtransferase [Pantoea sp. SoEX]MXP51009.1 rhodanese-related sulfurtransferase [Pantoea sp. SoEX]
MAVLHNRISNKELRLRLFSENISRITVSFYKYFSINNPKNFRDKLYYHLNTLKVFGRIYVSHEGINAQVSVPDFLYKEMKFFIYNLDTSLNNLHMNISLDNNSKSFWALRIKVRDRIVSDGLKDNIFNISKVGTYVEVEEVNEMINDPEVTIVDIRNSYEYEIGHFETAIKIPYNTFREQLHKVIEILKNYKNEKIVLYCTGGIRCEKASAWMIYNGFKQVYQIRGGIIEYVNYARKKNLPIMFKGKNFVFDQRMSETVSKDILSYCHQCKEPNDFYVNCANDSCHKLFIQCAYCRTKFSKCCSLKCQNHLIK